jgi:hypothetical protein
MRRTSKTITERTIRQLRREGWQAFVIRLLDRDHEARNFAQVIAFRVGQPVLAVAACPLHYHKARITTSKRKPALKGWLTQGGAFEVWSWCPWTWEMRREGLTLQDFGD